jgi:competence protein ComEA
MVLGVLVAGTNCGARRRAEPWVKAPLDVNTAAERDLQQLPGVTPSMARRIFEGRPYKTLDELVERGLLSERELDRVRRKITVAPQKP